MSHKVTCRELRCEFREVVRNPVNRFLFGPRWWEANLVLYRILGVPIARRIVMGTAGIMHYQMTGGRPDSLRRPYRITLWSNYVMQQDPPGMRSFIRATFFNESVHGFVVLMNLPILLISGGSWITWAITIFNLYLVLIQRYNRIRVLMCLIRLELRGRL